MFNYHNRQIVFKQSNGDLWNFFCDSRQNLCYNTLTRRGIWSNAVVLHKNAYQYFYADMDPEDIFHLIFQDNDGNIHYSRLDSQSIKTVPVLNSKMPCVYNKQLFLAPFKNSIYFFYVLQHENSFILACQVLNNGKISNPKVIDYVSGSSLPCAVLYDKAQNIYAFYQSYDGKYLQLGYKKFTIAQKHWSDFTPVTKYSGNCEYPHAIFDDSGIIHLCYQRRAPKLCEMVYQQKAPDKNLWTPEVIVHSSVHSFENASIVQANDNIVVYWVREDTIYYNSGSQSGNNWSKASRLNFPTGRQLQCLSYKSNSPRGGDGLGDSSQLPPAIYPGSLSNGFKLAFGIGDGSQLFAGYREESGASGSDIKRLVLDTFKQIQSNIDEVREGWSATKDEMTKLSNSYGELTKELGKYAIRLSMLESQLGQMKKLNSRLDILNNEIKALKDDIKNESSEDNVEKLQNQKEKTLSEDLGEILEPRISQAVEPPALQSFDPEPLPENKVARKATPSLEPDMLKEWLEWKEPKEWKENSE